MKPLVFLRRRDARPRLRNYLSGESSHTCHVCSRSSKLRHLLGVQMLLLLTGSVSYEGLVSCTCWFNVGIDLFGGGWQLSSGGPAYPLWRRLWKCLTLVAFKGVESRVIVVTSIAA